MGLDTYTGLTVASGDTFATSIFNKVSLNAEAAKQRLYHNGAGIGLEYSANARTFAQGSYWELPLSSPIYDTDRFLNNRQTNRISFTSAYTYAEFWAFLRFPVGNFQICIAKNGDPGNLIASHSIGSTTNQTNYLQLKSPIIRPTPGDFFSMFILVPGSGTSTLDQIFFSSYSGSIVTELPSATSASLIMRVYA